MEIAVNSNSLRTKFELLCRPGPPPGSVLCVRASSLIAVIFPAVVLAVNS